MVEYSPAIQEFLDSVPSVTTPLHNRKIKQNKTKILTEVRVAKDSFEGQTKKNLVLLPCIVAWKGALGEACVFQSSARAAGIFCPKSDWK